MNDRDNNILKFVVTNARSLAPKFASLILNFRELDLDFATVSETWHRVGDRKTKNKYLDEGFSIIERPRSTRGGGVAVVFNGDKIQLKQSYPYSARFEAVCCTGKWIATNRKVAIISAYLPPRMENSAVADLIEETRKKLEKIALDLGEHLVIFAGDLNKKDISQAFEDFPHVAQVINAPTRGGSCLDQCFTNISETTTQILPPLFDENGVDSDHAVCYVEAKLDQAHIYTKNEYWSRKYTVEGQEKFGECLIGQNWEFLEGKEPNEAVSLLKAKLDEWQDRFLPLKKHVVRSCDKPWITKRIKRLLRRKKRAFKKGGKGQSFHNKAIFAEREIQLNKIRFLDKVKANVNKDNDVRGYYRAIKVLKTEESQKPWNIKSMFPGTENKQIAEKAASFFNSISQEFVPVGPPPSERAGPLPPTCNQIRLRILKMKKPKSSVEGDIDSRLLGRFAAALSVPLKIIFAKIYETKIWPDLWKKETVTLLPKNKAPSGLAQLRNISCTPFFSKLLETFVMDGLKEDITLSESQFGGKKNQGVDHMLIETWDEIHRGLEEGATAVNIMAVDYEKAFNRLDHGKCLSSLRELGGKEIYIDLVHAFLYNRKMTVKVGNDFSDPKVVTGGAPQGSISGCFLFCATIDKLLKIKNRGRAPLEPADLSNMSNSSSNGPPSPPSPGLSEADTDSDESMGGFFRWAAPNRIDDTRESINMNNTQIRDMLEIEQPLEVGTVVKGYVDDFNVIERLDERLKITHHTTDKTRSKLRAAGSEEIFDHLGAESSELGMKINPTKTQMLCVSAAGNTTNSYIKTGGSKITSTKELKILGFWFDGTATVNLHVKKTLNKARSRLVALRTLKRSGLSTDDLLKSYTTYIRPLLDYAVPTYHPQLSETMSKEIERFQAKAMKIVYGPLVSYRTVLEHQKISSHQERRELLFRKFASKARANPAFEQKWFPPRIHTNYNLRCREPLEQQVPRTDRYKNSPRPAMRSFLNKQ